MPHAPISPRSLWWNPADPAAAERVDVEAPARPALAGDASADVVVIGAGVFGITVAARLAEAGKDVVVLESGRVGSGATGHSTAKATALQSPKYATIADLHGAGAAEVYATASLAAVEELLAHGEAVGGDRATAVTWTDEVGEVDRLTAELAAASRAGLDVRPASGDEFDLPIVHGIALDGQGQLDPLALCRVLARRAEAAGARIFEATPVTGASLTGAPRVVETAAGQVRAGHVVVATGLPVLDRGGWFARTEPHRSYALALRTDRRPLGMSLKVGSATRSARAVPLDDGGWLTLVAGEEHRTGRGGDTRTRPAALRDWADDRFGVVEVVRQWAAQDWRTMDELPLAGALVPGDDRVLAGAGFAKWGLTSGAIAAGVIADVVLGRPRSPAARLFDPARFRSLHTAKELAKANGTTGWAMAEGWLRVVRSGSRPALADGEGTVHREGMRPVATSRADGEEHSCLAVCPHLGGVVAWEPADQSWGCPLHGSRFAPDGRVLSGPATTPLPPA